MGDTVPVLGIGLIIGVFLTVIGFIISGNLHADHVRDYKACVELGAPQQNCFDKFLIQKGGQ